MIPQSSRSIQLSMENHQLMQKLIASPCGSVKSTSRPAGFGRKEKFFLKSSRRESISEYQISSDNPQKDNFHNLIFGIDNMVTFSTVNPTEN